MITVANPIYVTNEYAKPSNEVVVNGPVWWIKCQES
jgi:hypothetical protein